MESVEKSIEVEVPVQEAYNHWTHFERFPEFMEGVEQVSKLDERHLHWVAEIDGKKKEWDAEIYEQIPERRIAWRSVAGMRNTGVVEFLRKDAQHTRVTLKVDYEPEVSSEHSDGAALELITQRVEGDLERFKGLVQHTNEESEIVDL
jgi:uncharacterized membrane protein